MGLYREIMARWTCKAIDIEYMGYLIAKGLASYLDFSVFSVSQVTKLRKELNELKKKTESCSIDTALLALQALVGRSPALFDSYAAIAALEEVVDLAQKYAEERYSSNQIILRKCRPLVADASLQNILIKFVASKEEAEIARENKGTLIWIPKRSWVPKMLELWPAGPFAACVPKGWGI